MRRTSFFPILAATVVLAACTSPIASPTGDEPDATGDGGDGGTATGGTVRIGLPGYPDSLNPGLAVLAESYNIYELVYDTPVTVNPTAEFVPKLATEWSVSEDGLTWTVVI